MHGSISPKGQGMRYFKLNKNNELSHIFSETAHFAFYIKLKLVGDCINHFLCFFPTEARVGN